MFHTMYVAILFIYMVSALSQSTAQSGVYLEFKGQRLNSTSEVVLSDIGEQSTGPGTVDTARGDALVCVTDKSMCCRAADGASSTGDGGWFFPSMTPVPGPSAPFMGIYRNRGTGLVRLNRQSDSTYKGVGMFCCEVAGITQRVCVNVVVTLPPTAPPTTRPTTPPTTPPSMTTEMTTSTSSTSGTDMTTQTSTLSSTSSQNGDVVGPAIGAVVGILSVAVIIVIIVIVIIFSKRRSKHSGGTRVGKLQTVILEGKNLSLKSVKPTATNETAVFSEIPKVQFNRESSPIEEKSNIDPLHSPLYKNVAPNNQIKNGSTRTILPTRDPVNADRCSGQMETDDMYAVPYIVPSSPVGKKPQPDVAYSEINRSPPPEIPQKSVQLEDYLEFKSQVVSEGAANYSYAEIDGRFRPTVKSHTLAPNSGHFASKNMSENPLYEPFNRSKSLSIPTENVYADPKEPIAAAPTEKNMENIYETIYKEPIQPSLFKARAYSSSITNDNTTTLCPFSSIYTLPEVSVNNEVKPLIVSPGNIQEIQSLGVGNFGRVVLAKTTGLSLNDLKMSSQDDDKNVKIYVAVKMLKESVSKSMSELFEKEYKFMSKLNHPSVLRMLGVCTGDTPFIMMEYMEKGDLNQYLKKFNTVVDTESGGSHITTGTLVYMATQIASGMAYLAQKNFVHRDLATRNCLVGKGNVVKISDFGMSRNLYESHYYIIQGQAILPIRWMSTECFYGKFSAKSDVWAFGVTMWEIFTLVKEEPYFGLSDQEVVEDAIKGAGRSQLARPSACPIDVFRIMEECWVCEPSLRATFEDVFAQMSILNFKYGGN